jgi:hydrogenase maturation factor
MKMGKLANKDLKKLLKCIKGDPRVLVPPQVGYDAGVHKIGNKLLAVAVDPCTGVPSEWFGWLLVHYAASDVALFGAKPEFCTVTLMGPLGTEVNTFEKIMKQTCEAAQELGMAIVRGHTGTYASVSELVGVCTAYGIVAPERLKIPKNIQPGDLIVCTKPIGLETVINFSLIKKTAAQKILGAEPAERLAGQVSLQSCVGEAQSLAQESAVHAMHDVTEGGLVAALNELAEAAGMGFKIDYDRIPITPPVQAITQSFELSDEQALAMSSTGTILAAVKADALNRVEEALAKHQLVASVIGEFTKNKTRSLTLQGKLTSFPKAAVDPYAMILSGKV